MKQEKNRPFWVRLDNAAKIYPAARRRNWSNIYRLSVTLTEAVDVPVLQAALEVTVARFPTIAARLRKGAFWYYLEQVKEAPAVMEEGSYPLRFMSKAEMRRCAFRVIAYRERIAVEFFHSLTDGTGAMTFIKSLTAEYLEQKYGITVPAEQGVLDRRQPPQEEELEDTFPRFAGPVPASRKDTNAWRMGGAVQTDGFLHQVCFRLPVQEALERAHAYGCTLTVYLSAVMMQALMNLQAEKTPNVKRQKRIKLMIAVNLRGLFPSKTLRNFSMYTVPDLDPRLGEYTFEEICAIVRHKMGAEVTPKHMASVIATNVGDERNPLVRLIPLPLKNLVMKAVFEAVGERKSCLSFSNVGRVTLPTAMTPYVQRMDFILGVQASAPYNCGALSYGDTLYVNFIRNTRDPELERHYFAVLQQQGLSATVESNQSAKEDPPCIV